MVIKYVRCIYNIYSDIHKRGSAINVYMLTIYFLGLQFIFIFINLTFSWSGQIHTWLDVDTVSTTIPSEATASSMCVIMDLVETLLEDQCTTWASLA